MNCLLKTTCYMQPHATSASDASNKKQHVINNKKCLQEKLENKICVALKVCHPKQINMYKSNTCNVLWDEIEEISTELHNINNELIQCDRDYECWDPLECRVYDV